MHLLYTTSCAGSNTVCQILTSTILNSYSCKNGPYSDNDLVVKLFFFVVLYCVSKAPAFFWSTKYF